MVEQLVVLFPSLAAWAIVVMLACIGGGAAWAGRKFMVRLDSQDDTLRQIKELLASEVHKLREMHHDMEKRVVRLEAHADSGLKWTRRAGDMRGQ